MSVQTDIAEIKAALRHAERAMRKLHNVLAAQLAEHGPALGLTHDEVVAFGGGTPKDEDPEGGG